MHKELTHLTLIGYGIHTEMMLTLVSAYLRQHIDSQGTPVVQISHNIFANSEKLELVKPSSEVSKNVIFITPIASTFSTNIKMYEELCRVADHEISVLGYFNCLLTRNEKDRKSVV